MWSAFPNGTRYFSRTLAQQGPQASLRGDAGVRSFEVPFRLVAGSSAPTRLDDDVVLPGAGTVWVGPLALRSLADQHAAHGGPFARAG